MLLRLMAILGLSLTSACASIVTGTSQTVAVTTEPSGAACTLKRGDTIVGIVNTTPGTVRIDKSKDSIVVLCMKEGHDEGSETLTSDFQGATLGNILIGGVIGLAIDAGSGALNKYPEEIGVFLTPASFTSAEERDGYFQRVIDRIRANATSSVETINQRCAPDAASRQQCDSQIEAIESKAKREIQALEQRRLSAKVVGT